MDWVRSRRVGTRLAAIATTLLVAASAGCTRPTDNPTPPVTPTEVFEPGADGLGDDYYPTAGNGGYDVKTYDLDITYDPETDVIDGIATITATATASLSSFNLDFVGLKTQSVTVNGAEAQADHSRGELVVTPAKGINKGTEFVAKVTYGGVPESYNAPSLGGPIGFLNTRDGAVAIGEPEVAASWFPVNDHPRDKATYTIKLTAPDALAAISNGVLKEKKAAGKAGFTTWTWVESMPMAPYLATMVIGTYRVSEGTHDGLPVFSAVHTSLPSSVDATIARTPEVIDFLETVFGPYPFDAMGGIAINDNRIRFALENQTRPIYSAAFFAGGGDASWVVAHELAHQWFGDSVSVDTWKEIWLNEGFATYAEWLWEEHLGGTSVQRSFERSYQNSTSPVWQVPPGNPGKEDLFDQSVYRRGAMTLQALRITVGDDAFFKIIKGWAEVKKSGNATTDEFIALSEKLSGKELSELFDAWLYKKGRPPQPTP